MICVSRVGKSACFTIKAQPLHRSTMPNTSVGGGPHFAQFSHPIMGMSQPSRNGRMHYKITEPGSIQPLLMSQLVTVNPSTQPTSMVHAQKEGWV